MEIRDIQAGGASAPEASRRTRGVGSASSPSANTREGSVDRVALSDQAQALQHARRAALAVPEIREERVEEIRSGVADGSLVPDPGRIARALLDQHILD
jgi:flagellar biosynthesis anti-sigma factor FlgM